MEAWIEGLLGLLLDRSSEELIGALILALALSIAGSGFGGWLLRMNQDQTARMTGLMLVVSVVAMLAAGTSVQVKLSEDRLDPVDDAYAESFFAMPRHPRMVAVLDIDGDGRVSRHELRRAADALGTAEQAFPEHSGAHGTEDDDRAEVGPVVPFRPSQVPGRARDLQDESVAGGVPPTIPDRMRSPSSRRSSSP